MVDVKCKFYFNHLSMSHYAWQLKLYYLMHPNWCIPDVCRIYKLIVICERMKLIQGILKHWHLKKYIAEKKEQLLQLLKRTFFNTLFAFWYLFIWITKQLRSTSTKSFTFWFQLHLFLMKILFTFGTSFKVERLKKTATKK